MARARDLIRARKKTPSVQEVLERTRNVVRDRLVGSIYGRQYGKELSEAGKPPAPLPRIKPPRDLDAAEKIRKAQAKSPLFIEAIRRRLVGENVGSPLRTAPDLTFMQRLEKDAASLIEQQSFLARQRRKVEERLKGKLGVIQRAVANVQKGGLAAAQGVSSLFESAKNVVARLTGKELERKLAGFGIQSRAKTPTAPMQEPGYAQATPYQGQQMTAVSSSNVASIGWEPSYEDEPIVEKSLGTLFIQFTNGWLYKYVNAPFWLYEALMRAPSKGRAVWGLIRRGLYPDGIPYGSAAREGYERIQ